MATEYDNFFEDERMITKILNNKIITENLNSELKTSIKIDEATRSYINNKLNINVGTSIPIKITSKNVKEHSDVTADTHVPDDTYVIYLSDTTTQLKINNTLYSLRKNKAITFDHSVLHSTVNGNTPRLMLGPFNRNGVRMGPTRVDFSSYFMVKAFAPYTWDTKPSRDMLHWSHSERPWDGIDGMAGEWNGVGSFTSYSDAVFLALTKDASNNYSPTEETYYVSGDYSAVLVSGGTNATDDGKYTEFLRLTILPSPTPKGVVLCGKC